MQDTNYWERLHRTLRARKELMDPSKYERINSLFDRDLLQGEVSKELVECCRDALYDYRWRKKLNDPDSKKND
jgi:hypothetical protein